MAATGTCLQCGETLTGHNLADFEDRRRAHASDEHPTPAEIRRANSIEDAITEMKEAERK